jgi:hypothetical protein
LAGKFSRIIAILKTAPRQLIAVYRKAKSEAPGVPVPEALRKHQAPPAGPQPPGKDSPPK